MDMESIPNLQIGHIYFNHFGNSIRSTANLEFIDLQVERTTPHLNAGSFSNRVNWNIYIERCMGSNGEKAEVIQSLFPGMGLHFPEQCLARPGQSRDIESDECVVHRGIPDQEFSIFCLDS
jgi:hypothetical protein